MSENGHKDVRIVVPAAGARGYVPLDQSLGQMPTDEGRISFLVDECRRLAAETNQAKSVAVTMANIALCFAQMLVDHGVQHSGPREVTIPRWLSDQMEGLAISVRCPPLDDIVVTIRDKNTLEGPIGREA